VASRPSQSPKEEKTIAFQSLRNPGIAKTLRVASCLGAEGVGKRAGIGEVYRARQIMTLGLSAPFGLCQIRNNLRFFSN
jgi:hypothetical protein